MDSNISIEKLKTYSYGRLEIIRNELPKELEEKVKLLEKTEKSDGELINKLEKIKSDNRNEIIERVIKKIGESPTSIFYSEEGFVPISIIITLGIFAYFKVWDYWLFILPAFAVLSVIFSIIFYIPIKRFNKSVKEYEKKYHSLLDNEKNKSKLNLIINPLKKKKLDYENLENKLRERISLIESAQYKLSKLIMRAKDRERTAKAAAFDKQARIGSQTIRDDLLKSTNKRNWICPYCNKNKNLKTSEADHIHPVNKGGLSTVQNMVMICRNCNSKKKNLTLRTFCKKFNFDFNKICDTLESQGKDI